jgi:hypothetical protein
VLHDRYGIYGSPEYPHVLQTPNKSRLVEYPLSTYRLLGQTIPVAGGGYFRLYPYWLSRFFYQQINKQSNPFVFYLHPWEVDREQPRVKASWFSEYRHYNNLEHCYSRLSCLLNDFSFITMKDKLEQMNLFENDAAPSIKYQ